MSGSSFANPSFGIKLGSTLPELLREAIYTDGTPIDLTGAALEFRFQLVDNDGQLDSTATAQSGPAAAVPGTVGFWVYDWSTAPAVAGVYAGELGIALPAGGISYPFGGYIFFEVLAAVSV